MTGWTKPSEPAAAHTLAVLWQETMRLHFLARRAPEEAYSVLHMRRERVLGLSAMVATQLAEGLSCAEGQRLMLEHLDVLLKAELAWLNRALVHLERIAWQYSNMTSSPTGGCAASS